MARKIKMYVVPPRSDGKENGDAGKTFRITQMSAWDCEEWSYRALSAAARAGVPVSEDVIHAGLGAVLAVGVKALLVMSFDEAKPLLDDMMSCVEFIPDPSKAEISRRPDREDIEEMGTLLALRAEVVELHTGFSIPAFLSNLGKAGKKTMEPSQNTPTSPE